MPVTFSVQGTRRICAATVDNISMGGMLLLTDEQLDNDSGIMIHLPIDSDSTINVHATVTRTAAIGEFGVAFISLTDDEMDRISTFVELRAARS
jgi:PilZ domain-containing protein